MEGLSSQPFKSLRSRLAIRSEASRVGASDPGADEALESHFTEDEVIRGKSGGLTVRSRLNGAAVALDTNLSPSAYRALGAGDLVGGRGIAMDGKPTDESVTDAPENDSGLGPGAEKLVDEIEPVREDRNGDSAKPVAPELTREDDDTKAEGPILADPSFPVSSKPVRARRWSKLESISIENFKAIANTTVTLGDVTILVGPNGSGKSSVLQAIHWAVRARQLHRA